MFGIFFQLLLFYQPAFLNLHFFNIEFLEENTFSSSSLFIQLFFWFYLSTCNSANSEIEFIWKKQLRLVTVEKIVLLCIRALRVFFRLFDMRLEGNAEQGESSKFKSLSQVNLSLSQVCVDLFCWVEVSLIKLNSNAICHLALAIAGFWTLPIGILIFYTADLLTPASSRHDWFKSNTPRAQDIGLVCFFFCLYVLKTY